MPPARKRPRQTPARRVAGASASPVSPTRTETELARLAAIVEWSDDAIIAKRLDGTIETWNAAAERLYGYTRAEAVGHSIAMLVPPEAFAEFRQIMKKVALGERISTFETVRQRKDGSRVQVALTISPIRDAKSGVIGSSVITRDIAERKRMEGELWQSRMGLRAILDTAVDAIISIDGRGLVQSINPATERIFGYTAAEVIGQNVKILMPAPYHDEHDGYLARYKQTGEKRIIGIGREVQARRKDGTVFAADLAVSEVEPGKLFTGIIRDISDRKFGEAKLRESDRMASIGTLAAGLGHDMNNVLLPVRARLNALRAEGQQGKLSATASADVAEISKSVAYLQQLADGLHFLAMDPDTEEGAQEATDLSAWWSQAGVLISKAVPKHVRVIASFPAGLPKVAIAAHGLTQAVLNLIVNAGEAIPAGRKRRQGRVRVWTEAMQGATHVKLGVTDNGRGMSEEVKCRAFDMFFTTKSRGLGTGLGLTLVRKVADRAGGSVEIESTVGEGTTVAIVLPVVASAVQPTETSRAVVSLADGRAAAIVRHVLGVAGVRAELGSDPAEADIWITDPTAAGVGRAQAWRKRRPEGRLVLFGKPDRGSSREWALLHPVTIENRDNLSAIRAALTRAADGS